LPQFIAAQTTGFNRQPTKIKSGLNCYTIFSFSSSWLSSWLSSLLLSSWLSSFSLPLLCHLLLADQKSFYVLLNITITIHITIKDFVKKIYKKVNYFSYFFIDKKFNNT
jgi:hypothetical protein